MQFVSSQIIPDASNMATNLRCRKDDWANLINYLKELTKKENEEKLNYYQYQWSCRQRVVH